jgi:hypothetical protein
LAVTVVLAAGIVNVVVEERAFATVAPLQLRNDSPAGGVFALMLTVAPAA